MYASKRNKNSYQENEQFLSNSYASKEQFSEEYRRAYHGKPEAKELYRAVVAELKKAVLEGDVVNFKRFSEVIEYISGVEDRATIQNYHNDVDDPIDTVNFVVLVCKHNRLEILKYIFSDIKIFKNLSTIFANVDVVTPNDKDEMSRDAFYYAVRSNNTDLLNVLISEWPSNYFASRSAELDEILSKSYEELKLKNVFLSDEMENFVENELISLRFFSSTSGHVQNASDSLTNIIKRIDLVLRTIDLLKSQCSNDQSEVDARFLFVGGFIAKNIYVLKRQLKLTYDKLPWEEVEFCLVAFLSSYRKLQEINLFYRTVLHKSKILSYLEIFAKKLADVKPFIENLDVDTLANLPKSKRELIVVEIIRNDPQFLELYNDHQQIRDAHSLKRISDYLNLASSANVETKEGQLVITRTLQVIGEYLKNTLESPKMSSTTSELILSSLPKNTRKVVIDLRNSLSHAYSLSKRTEIEESSNADFFTGVQNDTKRIGDVVSNILYGSKTKMLIVLLKKIVGTENVNEMKAIAEVFSSVQLDEAAKSNFKILDYEKTEKLIRELRAAIPEKTTSEEWLFQKIDRLIDAAKMKTENIRTRYEEELSNLQILIKSSKDNDFDDESVLIIKFFVKDTLEKFVFKIEPDWLKQIVSSSIKISRSAKSRIQNDDILDTIHRLNLEILFIAEFEINDIKWIEKLKRKLFDKRPSSMSAVPMHIKPTTTNANTKYTKHLTQKVSELETILKSGEVLDSKRKKKLQAVVEMLVLDIMSILGRSKKHLENDLLFLDDTTPLLTGKCLRNHLAHGNALVDVLFSDPSTAVISNAKKLVSENIIKSKKKVGKLIPDNPTKLQQTFDQNFTALTNQENMFAALIKGDIEELKICLCKGADINARSINYSRSAIHLAAQGPSIEAVQFVVDHNVPTNVRDANGQTPLHIAAAHGRTDIVQFFLLSASVHVDDRDDRRKTPLHLAAKNGHKDTVEVLVKNNANTDTQDLGDYSPVHYAVRNNHIDVAKYLLNVEPHVDSNEAKGGSTALHIAAEFGRVELTDFLLGRGANVDAENDAGATPLHLAAFRCHLAVVNALILKGANVNPKVVNGCTPLHFAVESGNEKITEVLLKHGANVNAACVVYKNTPLHYATKDGREELVEILLKYKAKCNIATVEGITPLHFASQSGNPKTVASLLKSGAKIGVENNTRNYTALHYAAEYGHQEVAELLLRNGARVNAKAKNGLTPLNVAALKGHHHIVQLLIKHKARTDIRDYKGYDPLLLAARYGHKDVIDVLFRNNVRLDSTSASGLTSLHEAVLGGFYDIIDFLIQHGADVNAKDDYGFTLLHVAILRGDKDIVNRILVEVEENVCMEDLLCIAVKEGNEEIVEILVSNGANVNLRNDEIPPLVIAIKKNHREMVEVLIRNGANVNAKRGQPLMLAVISGYLDIFEVLLRNNARIDVKGPQNASLLHLAAGKGHAEIAAALISKGADVNAKTFILNATPLELAAEAGHSDVVEVLLANGAKIENCNGTALNSAAAYGHANVVDVLLRYGADIHAKDYENRTAVELAVGRSHFSVVERILQEGRVNVNATDEGGYTLLLIAAQQNNLKMVRYLVEQGSDIRKKTHSGSGAIHFAARDGYKDIVEFLLDKGVDIHEPGNANQTPLFYASMNDQLDVVKFLIDRGANVDIKDDYGVTPMHVAASFGFVDVVRTLLENGAVYNALDNRFRTPLDYFQVKSIQDFRLGQVYNVASRKTGVIDLLTLVGNLFDAVKRRCAADVKKFIKAGAFVNAKNTDTKTTPLHYAAWKGCEETVNILLENNAEINSTCNGGYTALHYAAKFAHLECVKILMYHGAIYNALSESGKTPLDLTKDKRIVDLFKTTDNSFRKIQNDDARATEDLNEVKVGDLKAIMNARNRDTNKPLIAVAMQSNFSSIEKLKQVSQGDTSSEIRAAIQLIHQGDFQSGLDILEKLFAKRKEILGPDNLATLDIQALITEGLFKQGNYLRALNLRQEIARKQEKILGLDGAATLSSREMIAFLHHKLGRNDEAFSMFQDVCRKQEEIWGPNHDNTINSQFHMALVLNDLGKYEEALKINKKVFEIRKSTHGESHLLTVFALNNIALVLTNLGEHEEALKIYKDVFEKKKNILGGNHADTLRTLGNMAAILLYQNKHQEALKTFEEILEIQKKTLPPNHPETLTTQMSIADILLSQQKFISAFKAYKRCYDHQLAIYGPSHSSVLNMNKKMQLIVDVQLKCRGIPISQVLQRLQNDINIAANKGDVQAVNRLLKKGADVNDRDVEGRTPLHFAVNGGHFGTVKLLLKNGADVTAVTNKGNTPLHTAASKNYEEIVQSLLQHVDRDKVRDFVNAKTTTSGTTSLHVAAKNGYLDMVKTLLKNGATYDIPNEEGKAPIDLANDHEIIKFLKLIDEVFKLTKKGSIEVVDRLKALKSDDFIVVTSARNGQGNGLLLVAIVNKHKNIAGALLAMLTKSN